MIEAILKTYYDGYRSPPTVERFNTMKNCCTTASLRNEDGYVTLIEDVRPKENGPKDRVLP
jgi:hypothetical protein